MVEKDESGADAVIKKSVGYAMLSGAIPLPVVDLTAVTAVQLDMMKKLATVYDADFDSKSSQAFLTSVSGALGGNIVARLGASVVKSVPGIGWLAGGITQILLTGAATYALGKVVQKRFREQQALGTIDVEAIRGEIEHYLDEGKKVAESIRRETLDRRGEQPKEAVAVVAALDHLERLHDIGGQDEEFATAKAKAMSAAAEVIRDDGLAEELKTEILQRANDLVVLGVLTAAEVSLLQKGTKT